MKDFVCLNPHCDGKAKHGARGLCLDCYSAKRNMVNRGRDTWESDRYRRPGLRGKHHFCEIPECINLAMIDDYDNKPVKVDGQAICTYCYARAKTDKQTER